jgi:Sporulation and spore germination
MSKAGKILLVILLLVLVGGGYYLRGLWRHLLFERGPKLEDTAVRTRLNEAALQSPTGPSQFATLYFPVFESGTLAAESRALTWASNKEDRVRQILLALTEGSHEGHNAFLPPEAALRAVFFMPDGTVTLDFSNELRTGIQPGIESENLVIYSIVNSLAANLPSVKQVRFLIQGQVSDTLAGHEDLSGPFVPTLPPPSAPQAPGSPQTTPAPLTTGAPAAPESAPGAPKP